MFGIAPDMEIYDFVMVAVLIAATVFGGIKGFAWQLASITSIVGSYFVAYRFRDTLAARIDAQPPWDRFLAMLILFIACSLTVWVLFRMCTGAIDRLKLHEFDHHVGAVFGLLKGCLYCVLATLFAITLCGERVRESVLESRSGTMITQWISKSESVVPPEVLAFVQPHLDQINAGEPMLPGDAADSPPMIANRKGGFSRTQGDARGPAFGPTTQGSTDMFGNGSTPRVPPTWQR